MVPAHMVAELHISDRPKERKLNYRLCLRDFEVGKPAGNQGHSEQVLSPKFCELEEWSDL